MIVQPSQDGVPVERQTRALHHLREALAAASRLLNFQAFIATADRPCAEDEIERAYVEARDASCTSFFLKENALIVPSMSGHADEGGYTIPELALHDSFLADTWRTRVDAFFAAPFRDIRDGARRMKLHVTVALESINSLLLRSYAMSFDQVLGESAGSLYERVFQVEDEGALRALLDDVGSRVEKAIEHTRHGRTIVGSVQAYIERNYARPLSLNEIADIFHISMSYLCTIFKQETGTNFTDYVHRVRLRHACELFADRSLSLKEISFAVGYQSADHFSRVFSRIMGDTASAYREKLARGEDPGAPL